MSVITMPPAPKPQRKIAERQLALRQQLWPHITDGDLWLRKQHDGYMTVPRTMPLMMSIMDDMAKGTPISMTYLELWGRAFDECLVVLSKPKEMAFHSGFGGQRAERAWSARIKILAELGFINVKAGPSGPLSYALILNPYQVIQRHFSAQHVGIRQDKYYALIQRAGEIRADEFPVAVDGSLAKA